VHLLIKSTENKF